MNAVPETVLGERSPNLQEAGREASDLVEQALGSGGESTPEVVDAAQTVQETDSPDAANTGAEQQVQGEDSPDGEQATAEEIQTIVDLARAIEVEPEYLYRLKMNLNETGESLTLGEIKDRLQEADKVLRSRTQYETERNTLERERQQFQQQVQQAQQQFMQLPQEAQTAHADMRALEMAWEHLEANKDSFEAGDLALKKQELQAAYSQAQGKYNNTMQKLQQETQQRQREALDREAAQVLRVVPEWKDAAVATEGRQRIGNLMAQYGFDASAAGTIIDHRVLHMLHDFAQMKANMKEAEVVLNKGKVVPKVLKPGSPATPSKVRAEQLDKQLDQAAKSRDMRLKSAAVANLLRSL